MAQHDYVIANQSGSSFRSDLNNALSAIVSQNSGSSAPSTTYAYQTWADTANGVMKMRDGANSAWITLYQLDGEWSTIAFENGTAAAPSIYFKDSGTDTGFYSPGANEVGISTGGTSALVVDSTGRLLVGTSTARANIDAANSLFSPQFQIEGTSVGSSSLSIIRNTTAAAGYPRLFLAKSKGATVGSNTAVASGDDLGEVLFNGADGTNFIEAAGIKAQVDGTPGTDDMPGRLVFSTTADGASSPTPRVQISSNGELRLLAGCPGINFADIQTNAAGMTSETLDSYEQGTWTPVYEPNVGAFTSVTYDPVRYGKYTKIGNLVICSFAIRTDAITVGTASGAVAIGGLPFTSTTTAGTDAGSGSVGYSAAFGGDAPIGMIVSENSTSSILYYRATVNGNSNALDVTDLGTGANANYVIGVISYFVS